VCGCVSSPSSSSLSMMMTERCDEEDEVEEEDDGDSVERRKYVSMRRCGMVAESGERRMRCGTRLCRHRVRAGCVGTWTSTGTYGRYGDIRSVRGAQTGT
jgi:hypothetical protein